MLIEGVKSKRITVGDDLFGSLAEALQKRGKGKVIREGDILVIASKVVAITQGRVRQIEGRTDFGRLVTAEADRVVGGGKVILTVKNGIFVPWAGVDRSNTPKGTAVLWPKEPFKAAETLQNQLKKTLGIKKLGIIITDSFCVPLRRGVTAVALGYAGFAGVNDLRGKKDLYGNRLKVSQQAMADMVAAAAHLVMGESKEQTPFAIVRKAPVRFTNRKTSPKEPRMGKKECLYSPLYGDWI